MNYKTWIIYCFYLSVHYVGWNIRDPNIKDVQIPVTPQSKTQICDRPLAGIAGLNPTGVMDICLLRMLCFVLKKRGICDRLISRPEEPYLVWCFHLCLISKPEQWGDLAGIGLLHHKKKYKMCDDSTTQIGKENNINEGNEVSYTV